MKKKPLLFALLALAIVTSLTAGTLAVYTKSVTLDGDVQIKKFAFSAKGEDTYVKAVKLAPGHDDTTAFTVTNADKNGQAEVDMNYTIVVDITETEKAMKGLMAELINENGDVLEKGTKIEYTDKLVAGKDPVTDAYKVKLTWVDDGKSNEAQTKIGASADPFEKGLKISVTANQL